MAITWRAAALAAVGLLAVLVLPATGTVLVWTVLVVVACVLDALLAASPREVAVSREVPASVRLTEPARSTLTLTNVGRRRLRALVRDAWPPSSGATDNRHTIDAPAGDGRRVTTVLVPTRRGDAHADRVTVRTV